MNDAMRIALFAFTMHSDWIWEAFRLDLDYKVLLSGIVLCWNLTISSNCDTSPRNNPNQIREKEVVPF